MSLKQKALTGVIWSLLQRWGNRGISFLVFLLLARLLEPKDFGLIALASIFLSFIQLFADQGFSQAIVQRPQIEPEHLDTAFWSNLGIGALFTLTAIGVAPWVAEFFREPQIIPIVRWLSLSFLLGGLSSVQSVILTRNLDFKVLAVRSLIASFAGAIVGIAMAFLNYGVWSLVGRQLAEGVVSVAILWKVSPWQPGLKVSVQHFQELFSFGIHVIGIDLLNFFNRRLDDLLIGYFLGAVALGYYSVAYRLLLLVSEVMIATIQGIAMPVFSRLQEDPQQLKRAFFKAIQVTALVSFPAFVGLSILAPEIITTVFGQQWKPSIPVMQVLALMGFMYAGFYYNGPLIMAMGKPGWNLALNGLQAIGNAIAFAIAVRWGIVAVAISYVFYGYLMSPVPVLVIRRLLKFKLSEYLDLYKAPVISSIVMAISILSVRSLLNSITNGYLQIGVYGVVGVAMYVLSMSLVAPSLTQQTLTLFRTMLSRSSSSKTV